MVFQHFGHTAEFKFYEVENGQVTASEVVSTNGQGHGALVGFLAQHNANVVFCGGIGPGAQNALRLDSHCTRCKKYCSRSALCDLCICHGFKRSV